MDNNNIEITNLIWKSEYNIGNLKIDQEHQKLFSIASAYSFTLNSLSLLS